MADVGLLVLLTLCCGLLADVRAVQVVNVPSDVELTQTFLDSERQHSDNFELFGDTDELPTPASDAEFDVNSIVASTSSVLDVCGTVNLNKIVDEMLDSLRKDIVKRGKDKISIPNIHENFTKKVGIVKVKGVFDAEQGWVKNLSTVHRTADVFASSYGKWISVSCGFGLAHLELGYDEYKASFMKLGIHGQLDGLIAKNSILLNATVSWENHTCVTKLNEFVLNQFGGLKLRVTGLGPLNWLFSKISTWILQHFKSEIKMKVETTLREEIEELLSHFDCSKYFPKF
ncbi:mite allergen Lep d 7-like [Periplaneta americana]|uniref:mite allergen Lep d 7-like n=1 Tax=Periplaneta americana TaxID=6978 RepID=UPI0037E89EE4